ncbi:DUF2933 domain-containing protein [Pseudomonas sp. MBLB4136]|uniref:DUF2933 domain-containing protein n=1 Tax=Pseudomonas sp. MBLB4136 TaxID=3451558 RepID=UPI003F753CEB
MPHSPPSSDPPTPPFWKSRNGVVLMMLLAIALFYLAREHYGHISQLLPYLILLLCPLMHLFGHHHGGHRHRHGESGSSRHEPRE